VSIADFERYPLIFGPSPMHPLQRLSEHLGGAIIWAKREDVNAGLAYGGNKMRKLEYLIPDALRQRADTLVSIGGVQSNHTRHADTPKNVTTISDGSIMRENRHLTADYENQLMVGWPGGIAPPGSHGTERDSLPSLRSSHRNPAVVCTHFQCVNSLGSSVTILSHHVLNRR